MIMKYKLINNNNIVTFKMRTGNDLVRSKMGIAFAQSLIARAKNIAEVGEEIIVDDTYFFPIEVKKRAKAEEVTE